MVSEELKILNSLYPFAEAKAKLITNKKVKLGIINKTRYHNNGQVYAATIKFKDEAKPPYFLIEIDKRVLIKFSLTNLKHIVSHEIAHIPDLEKPKLITRIGKNGKKYKMYRDDHGKDFTNVCKKIKVVGSFSKSNLNGLKKFK